MSRGAHKEVAELLENPNLNPCVRFLLEQYQKVGKRKAYPDFLDCPKGQIKEYLLRLATGALMSEQGDIVRGDFVPAPAVCMSRDGFGLLLDLAHERADAMEEALKEGDDEEELLDALDCILTGYDLLHPGIIDEVEEEE